MQVRRLRIRNYKGFSDSGWITLAPSFTVVVGQNNAGKTSFLEAFRLSNLRNKPHRSPSSVEGEPIPSQSRVDAEIVTSGAELRPLVSQLPHGTAVFPFPPNENVGDARKYVTDYFGRAQLVFNVSATQDALSILGYPAHALFKQRVDYRVAVNVTYKDGELVVLDPARSNADSMSALLALASPRSIYVFKAERLNIGAVPPSSTSVLEPDGSNLAAVLARLQSNPGRFRRLNDHVSEIFPTIRNVTVDVDDKRCEVVVWSHETERGDLAIPLQESGTGIGQVLAILYVAMTIRSGLIVIDEPNAFLHPGAAKKLIEILRTYESNQFVLSTHSGELLTTANPELVLSVSWSGETVVQELDRKNLGHLRKVLAELGVRFSEVFGYDRVIWVEGQTEEVCFPMIVEALKLTIPAGTIFKAIIHTGDFERKAKDKRVIWRIYEQLSGGPSLFPALVGFSFDRETRSESEIEDFKKRSLGKAHFTSRRSFENYLIHAEAIAAVVSQYVGPEGKPVTSSEVENWLTRRGAEYAKAYSGSIAISDADWFSKVDAPRLLRDLFGEISGMNLEYSKTTHSVALVEWLIANQVSALDELGRHIEAVAASLAKAS